MPSAWPPATSLFLGAFVVVFGLQQLWPDAMLARFGLWPDVGPILVSQAGGERLFARFQAWQFLSHGFLHGGVMHLLLNGMALAMFGAVLEQLWGSWRFTLFLLACIVGGGLAQWWGSPAPVDGGVSVTLGASGGVMGVIAAYAIMFPRQRLLLLFPPVPMPAWLLALLFAVVSTVLGVTGLAAGIAHFAHLGGMLTGVLLYAAVARRWTPRRVDRHTF